MGYSMYEAGGHSGVMAISPGCPGSEGPSTQTLRFGDDVTCGVREMAPIRTPFGMMTLSAEFRRDCSFVVSGCRAHLARPAWRASCITHALSPALDCLLDAERAHRW